MTTHYTLLVLADGSERTLQTARYLAEFMPVGENARIVLFHVLGGIPEEYRELMKDETCECLERLLQARDLEGKAKILECLEQAKQILLAGGFSERSIEIKLRCQENGVARDIIEEAKKGYTAVVLRRRGLGALKNMILGSVAVKLLQALTFIPILLVGQAPPARRVLLAVDESSASMKAVGFVGSLLGGQGHEVCVFHAISGLGAILFDLPEGEGPHPTGTGHPESCIVTFKAKIARMFHTVRRMLLDAGFEPADLSEKIVSGVHSRPEAIVREAERGGYGAIVVGRRGLSRVEAFFMGRVSHAVVYEGKCFSVWVV